MMKVKNGIYSVLAIIMVSYLLRQNTTSFVYQKNSKFIQGAFVQIEFCGAMVTEIVYAKLSEKALSRELSFAAMKYEPPTSVQLTLLDQ